TGYRTMPGRYPVAPQSASRRETLSGPSTLPRHSCRSGNSWLQCSGPYVCGRTSAYVFPEHCRSCPWRPAARRTSRRSMPTSGFPETWPNVRTKSDMPQPVPLVGGLAVEEAEERVLDFARDGATPTCTDGHMVDLAYWSNFSRCTGHEHFIGRIKLLTGDGLLLHLVTQLRGQGDHRVAGGDRK